MHSTHACMSIVGVNVQRMWRPWSSSLNSRGKRLRGCAAKCSTCRWTDTLTPVIIAFVANRFMSCRHHLEVQVQGVCLGVHVI